MGEEIRDKTGFTGLIACHWGKVKFMDGVSVGITPEQREGLLAFGHNYCLLDEGEKRKGTETTEGPGEPVETEPSSKWPDEFSRVLEIDQFAEKHGFKDVLEARGKKAKLEALNGHKEGNLEKDGD